MACYELLPCHLLAYHGNWYLLAKYVAKDLMEPFALSRFRSIDPRGLTFTRPSSFDPETYARRAFSITGGDKPLSVMLLFESKVAVYITE